MLKESISKSISFPFLISLNPYFNGTCSKRMEKLEVTSKVVTS